MNKKCCNNKWNKQFDEPGIICPDCRSNAVPKWKINQLTLRDRANQSDSTQISQVSRQPESSKD